MDNANRPDELSYDEIMALYDKHGSERKAAKAMGIPRTTLQKRKYDAYNERFTTQRMRTSIRIQPGEKTMRFILTSAQDSTAIHSEFLTNLEVYADFCDAQIMVAGYTYNKGLFEDHSKQSGVYPSTVLPYLVEDRIVFGDTLTFCAEMNILPTAVNPLSGMQTYTGPMSGIIPHAKVQLESIPTQKGERPKIMQTTGTLSLPNYVQKKAGQKAEHYHEVSAVIVELLPDGRHFVRHLHADRDGSFQDLDILVSNGDVEFDQRVEGITWGDIHWEKHDKNIAAACWGMFKPKCEVMIDVLKPKYSFIHDIIDFMPRNHHNIKDPHFRFEMYTKGTDSVEETIDAAAYFLQEVQRPFSKTVVVESNHDLALLKWLKTADYREDPVNARYFLELQTEVYRAIEAQDSSFSILEYSITAAFYDVEDALFLREDQSYLIANGIECGMHGHLGANGARGHIGQYARSGRRSNSAHTHSAAIKDGAWCAGVSGSMEMGYNKGLSSWSHSHIVTYPNGKRAMITQYDDGLWCADAVVVN